MERSYHLAEETSRFILSTGPQYVADAFRNELAWLGITHSPSFVGEPQCNGVMERFIRTLKEQCLWLYRFETLDEAR